MGGIWEAGIKSVKYHLKRALGRSRLTYEEFETVIIQVEGILNSRPLTPISNDFDNFEVLTPAHFLIGRSINSILEPPIVLNINDNRLSRWQKTTKVIQVVWKKWSTDNLNTLQQRRKWMIEKDNVMCGTVVIVKEDFTPVCNWLLGRVVEVYHGTDGKDINELDSTELKIRKNRFDVIGEELTTIFDNLFSLARDDEIEYYILEKQALLDTWEEMLILLERRVSHLNKTNKSTEVIHTRNSDSTEIKLPTLSLPTFSGVIDEWLTFSDLFQAAVTNQNLTGAQKLQYLKGVLKGDAQKR
ncbi:integrase catalytic domain-containing protein [Trichonephila clavipes]|uniref:Integrase catalytic domain-containing protein n=1 Tax=Trichonephila clavipes TaxID=2585209 RepID=A0A8X6SBD1_TRICX|nr:integrase catalytic domain-containing protein [Trichonephila clavipes]